MTRMDTHLNPSDMCRHHLLGNHNEAHQLVGYLRSADSDSGALTKLFGHAARGQIDLTKLRWWHDRLADEMERRGYEHDSPMDYDELVPIGEGAITPAATNRLDWRCEKCGASHLKAKRGDDA